MTKRKSVGGGGTVFRGKVPLREAVGAMRVPPAIFALAFAMLIGVGCAIPDVVLRPNHHFTKLSSITLVSEIAGDPAMFKPELEKEMIRRGYNVISDTTAAVVEQQRRTGDSDAAIAAAKEAQRLEVAGKGKYGQLTESQTVKKLGSDYGME